jgi:hypothetical protein
MGYMCVKKSLSPGIPGFEGRTWMLPEALRFDPTRHLRTLMHHVEQQSILNQIETMTTTARALLSGSTLVAMLLAFAVPANAQCAAG